MSEEQIESVAIHNNDDIQNEAQLPDASLTVISSVAKGLTVNTEEGNQIPAVQLLGSPSIMSADELQEELGDWMTDLPPEDAAGRGPQIRPSVGVRQSHLVDGGKKKSK